MASTRRSVELPDGSEFEYWMHPVTLAERAKAQKSAGGDDPTSFALQLLVAKAMDENGQKLFAPGEIAELKNALPASVVEALMLQLLAEAGVEEEEETLDPKPSRRSSRKTES
jgi:hypothetical protein